MWYFKTTNWFAELESQDLAIEPKGGDAALEKQKNQARSILEAASKLPDSLKETATAYLQGMAAAAKLMKQQEKH